MFNSCGMDSASSMITVLPPPLVQIVNSDTTVLINTSVVFKKVGGSGVQYFWANNAQGTGAVSTETYTVTFNQLGKYPVYLFGENMNGCKALDSVVVTVVNNPIGMQDPTQFNHSLNMYPNPTSGSLIISLQAEVGSKLDIGLYNLNGMRVQNLYTGKCAGGIENIETQLNGVAPGLYICRVQIDGAVSYRKVMKN